MATTKKAVVKKKTAAGSAAKAVAKKKATPAKKPAAKKAAALVNQKVAVVTGASGFAGGHMTDFLIDRGFHVIATDLESADRKYVNPKAEFIPADITNPATLGVLFKKKPAIVYHPAAVFDYEAPWDLCEKVNVFGTRNLCDISVAEGVKRFVLFSTVSVYGHPKPEELPVVETNEKRPGTNYERSKWMQEQLTMEYLGKGLPVSVVRPAPVYGPRNVYGFATIIFLIAKFPIVPFPVNIDMRMVGVSVQDVCGAAYFVSTKKEAIGEAYNIADDSDYKVREVVQHLCPALGVRMAPVFIPKDLFFAMGDSFADISRSVAKVAHTRPFVEKDMVYYLKAIYSFSNKKLKDLGYQLHYPDMLKGLTDTVDWYKENGYLDRRELWMKVFERI